MITYITPDNIWQYGFTIDDFCRLRHNIYKDRLKWWVKTEGPFEVDDLDDENASYIIYENENNLLLGGMRLTKSFHTIRGLSTSPSINEHMEDKELSLEISRFCLNTLLDEDAGKNGYKKGFYELLAALHHFGVENKIKKLFLVTDKHLQEVFEEIGSPFNIISPPSTGDGYHFVVGEIIPSQDVIDKLIDAGNLQEDFILNKKESQTSFKEKRRLEENLMH